MPGSGFLASRRARLMPGFAAVIRALNDLSEPAAGLRGVDTIGISGGSLEVVNFPAGKMGTTDVPLLPLAIRSQNECTFARANQNSYAAHPCSSITFVEVRLISISVCEI